jgi:hypothetical protein
MPRDANMDLQSKITSTSTAHSTALTMIKAAMKNVLYGRFIYSAMQQASGSGVVTFSIDWDSCTSGVTWSADWVADPITLTASAQSGELFVPFLLNRQDIILPGNASVPAPKIRASATLSGSPTTPTWAWQCDIVPSRT